VGYGQAVASGKGRKRLTEGDIELVAQRLEAGEYLDEYLQPLLFRRQKETELSYAAKEPVSRVLADTMAVPLQTIKAFGEGDGWTNKLVVGDNLQVLKRLLDMKQRGELVNADGSHGIRCCYIDPPFATRKDFRGRRGQRAYRDRIAGAAFVEFLRKRLVFIRELLTDDGSLWLHLDSRRVHYLKVVCDELFGEHNFRNEVVWKRTTAHNDAATMGNVHETLLLYSKGPSPKWHPQWMPYEEWYVKQYYRYREPEPDGRRFMSADYTGAGPGPARDFGEGHGVIDPPEGRHWMHDQAGVDRMLAENRIFWTRNGVPRLKRYLDDAEGQPLHDMWTDILPIVSWSDEGEDYPTQKPLRLLERVITACTDPGDLVLDAFAGSGTTALAAEQLDRRWLTVDSGKFATYVQQRRLLSRVDDGEDVHPFELCTAGLYDNDKLERLGFDGFQSFCLELFNCRADPHAIANIQMAGTRKGDPVHFIPFDQTDAVMGREYVESLAERLKGKHTGPFYVVAPVSHCDPGLFEDVIPLQGIGFYILRVPYSVIEALHGRRFQLIDQPFSEELLNDPSEAFGFDFMQPPEAEVAYAYAAGEDTAHVTIRSFQRGGLDPDDFEELEQAGRLDLAMVMLDRDFKDDGHFRLGDHYFGDVLEDRGWTFAVPLADAGEAVAFVYLDVHGNELRKTVPVAELRAAPALDGAKRRRAGKRAGGTKPKPAAKQADGKKPTAKRAPKKKAAAKKKPTVKKKASR
jgi:DNA methylase